MANYYTQFSELIECSTDAEAEDLIALLKKEAPEGLDLLKTDEGVHAWCDEGTDLDKLLYVLKDWLVETGRSKPLVFSWAHTCSKPEPGAFGGGAAMVTPSYVVVMDARAHMLDSARAHDPVGSSDGESLDGSAKSRHREPEGLITRKDYLNGRVTHDEYYLAVGKTAGISFRNASPEFLGQVKTALDTGDEHLNTIEFDGKAGSLLPSARNAFETHGDTDTFVGRICLLKRMARDAAVGH